MNYEKDFADWAKQQATALRTGQVDALDLENLAEEIEGLVRSDKRALASQMGPEGPSVRKRTVRNVNMGGIPA